MKIAYTIAPKRGGTDHLLFDLAEALAEQGLRVSGTVQINTAQPEAGPCDMDVKVLPDGPVIRISQSLGRGSKGCRLDPAALETAVGLLEAKLSGELDCLIINKFGKHEVEGRGFRQVIAEALSRDIPVIVGLNDLNRTAFLEFAGDLATEVPPQLSRLETWLALWTHPAASSGEPVMARMTTPGQ